METTTTQTLRQILSKINSTKRSATQEKFVVDSLDEYMKEYVIDQDGGDLLYVTERLLYVILFAFFCLLTTKGCTKSVNANVNVHVN